MRARCTQPEDLFAHLRGEPCESVLRGWLRRRPTDLLSQARASSSGNLSEGCADLELKVDPPRCQSWATALGRDLAKAMANLALAEGLRCIPVYFNVESPSMPRLGLLTPQLDSD